MKEIIGLNIIFIMMNKMYRLCSREKLGGGSVYHWYGKRLALAGSVRTSKDEDIVSANGDIG